MRLPLPLICCPTQVFVQKQAKLRRGFQAENPFGTTTITIQVDMERNESCF